jgi:hypothetical protein
MRLIRRETIRQHHKRRSTTTLRRDSRVIIARRPETSVSFCVLEQAPIALHFTTATCEFKLPVFPQKYRAGCS